MLSAKKVYEIQTKSFKSKKHNNCITFKIQMIIKLYLAPPVTTPTSVDVLMFNSA